MKKKVFTLTKGCLATKYVQTGGVETLSQSQRIIQIAREISKNQKTVNAFLEKTGMYDTKGNLKQEFR